VTGGVAETGSDVSLPGSGDPTLRRDLHFAVVVGINRYPGLATSLRGPRKDAQDVYDWLVSSEGGGLSPKNVKHIDVDPSEVKDVRTAKPTRDVINEALEDVESSLQEHLTKHPLDWQYSRLYLYLSGHGIAPHAREAALLMANARLGRLENLPAAVYMGFFQDQQVFHELVFFADCCRTVKDRATILAPPWDPVRRDNGQVATVIGFATGFGNLAYEPTPAEESDPDQTRGFFTKALIEGLKGNAADMRTGAITSETLSKYLRQRVIDLTSSKPTPQEPSVYANVASPIVFRPAAAAASIPKWDVTINFPPWYTGNVVLSDGAGNQVAQATSTTQPWTLPLQTGFYEVRPEGEPDGSRFNSKGLFRVTGGPYVVQL
jgi:hypothetical protein